MEILHFAGCVRDGLPVRVKPQEPCAFSRF